MIVSVIIVLVVGLVDVVVDRTWFIDWADNRDGGRLVLERPRRTVIHRV